MSARRLIVFLLGVWLGGSLFLFGVATHNMRSADEILANPAPQVAAMRGVLGQESLRMLLRHQAAELNRFLFDRWEVVELLLGLAILLLLVFASSEGKWPIGVSAAMLLMAAALHFIVSGDLASFGRQLDFTAAHEALSERARFQATHRAYSIAQIVKCALGAGLLALLLRRSRRKRRAVHQVDLVDHPDDPHVDR